MRLRWTSISLPLFFLVLVFLLPQGARGNLLFEYNDLTKDGFEGPCGVAVDATGGFYVAEPYRNRVVGFNAKGGLLRQLTEPKTLDGPCGLSLAPNGDLFVNNFHQGVIRLPHPAPGSSTWGPGQEIFGSHATGVSADPGTGRVYVNARTAIRVYDSTGKAIETGGQPLRIGEGNLVNGYGVAAMSGRIYVADAGDGSVKVFEPAVDLDEPVQVWDGSSAPGGGFSSLRDAVLAVDRVRGLVYLADDLQPNFFEEPLAAIYAFDLSGGFEGQLATVVNARPVGLAVDNSPTVSQGRVYVTSGNTEGATVLVYEPIGSSGSLACDSCGSSAPIAQLAQPSPASAVTAPAPPPSAGKQRRRPRCRHRKPCRPRHNSPIKTRLFLTR